MDDARGLVSNRRCARLRATSSASDSRGVPFFLLSASAPLLQSWYSASRSADGKDPYFLYASSNLGSLFGLLSYPFLIEPRFTLFQQRELCVGLFVVVVGLFFWCATAVGADASRVENADEGPVQADSEAEAEPVQRSTRRDRARWALLAAGPSAMLMGITGFLTINIAPVPMLWVLPLTLYLLTFVIAFARRKVPAYLVAALVPVLAFPAIITIAVQMITPIQIVIPLHLVAFFVIALACHSQLNELRPHAKELTDYYVWISIGGGLGGVFAAIVAPAVFHSLVEYPIAIAASCIALGLRNWDAKKVPWDLAFAVVAGIFVYRYLVPKDETAGRYNWAYFAGGLAFVSALRPLRYGLVIGATLLVANFIQSSAVKNVLLQDRNFFGVHIVSSFEGGKLHDLMNGTTTHGEQWTTPPLETEPLTYYSRKSPIGQTFKEFSGAKRKNRVAVVGLGTGTLACYGEAGQQFDFYDIDPMVVQIAEDPKLFTYLQLCKAKWRIVMGDARLSLARSEGGYGIVALDAFASDAIPVHLITVEAFKIYESKLAPHGVIAVHISNRYLDLRRVVAGAAAKAGMVSIICEDPSSDLERDNDRLYPSIWMLVARDKGDFGSLGSIGKWATVAPGARPWTDDYSDIVETMTMFQHER